MNFDSFSHGQILSKMWLCEKLEPYLPKDSTIAILACWYNVLGFMLVTRNPQKFKSITGIDIDPDAVAIADKICNAWTLGSTSIKNICGDVNAVYQRADVVINCSPEHITGSDWFYKIASGTLVCIQSSNVTDPTEPWLIKTPHPTLEKFRTMYPLATTHFCESQRIQYATWGYDRYMIIGVK
jgi:hypothetical protein